MIEFILARYNYWIVIILMMTGLYIVFSRGNLVKTVVGLNIFQTSVFIFYITLGKVAGGTAPILVGGEGYEEGHGGDHGEDHAAGHGAEAASHYGDPAAPLSAAEAESYASGALVNDVGTADPSALPTTDGIAGLHDAPVPANSLGGTPPPASPARGAALAQEPAPGLEIVGADEAHGGAGPTDEGYAGEAHGAVDAALDVLYSNPLPHVLILTAIVVGVATTAVGLAIAVRIREAYGTVEEDALEAMDNAAEFGGRAPDEGGAPA